MPPAVHPFVGPFVRMLFIVSQSVSQYSTAPLTHSLNDVIAHFGWRYVNTTFLFVYGRLRCAWDVGMQKFYVKFSIQSSNNSNTNQTNNSSIRLATKTNLLALLSDIHTPTRQPTRSSREREREQKRRPRATTTYILTHVCSTQLKWWTNVRMNEWNLVTSVKPTFLLIC